MEIWQQSRFHPSFRGETRLFLHYLVLKYMESIYKEEMKGLSRHIPFGSKKNKKSKDTSTPNKSIFNIDLLVLTRWAFLHFFLLQDFNTNDLLYSYLISCHFFTVCVFFLNSFNKDKFYYASVNLLDNQLIYQTMFRREKMYVYLPGPV